MIYPPGTEVVYTNAWLYSTGQAPCGEACRYRGVVISDPKALGGLDPSRFVVVQWSHDPTPTLVLAANVAPLQSAKALDVPSWVSLQKRRKRRR